MSQAIQGINSWVGFKNCKQAATRNFKNIIFAGNTNIAEKITCSYINKFYENA